MERSRSSRSFRVLVVDDYAETAEIACVLLGIMGYECAAATSGGAALEVARRFDPEIVLLDLGLPDMSGCDVARALRARCDRALRIVALTGWSTHEARDRALAAGVDVVAWKPLDAAKLRHVLAAA